MPFSNMSLEDLARHIGMDAREVKRLAERGALPGQMVGGQWRFNRAAMLDWLQREMHSLDEDVIRNLERAMSDRPDEIMVGDMLAPDGIDLALPARSKHSVLRELTNLADRTGLLYDPATLLRALEEREELCSTGLPGGIAFPHPRRPLPHAAGEPFVCLARVPAGIPYGAPDGRMTDIFVLVCCPDEREHLRTLARLALLFTAGLADKIRGAADAVEALDSIIEYERVLLERRK